MRKSVDQSIRAGDSAISSCLKMLKQQQETLESCLEGRQMGRELLIEHIRKAQQADAERLAAFDKEIADLKSDLEAVKAASARFRKELRPSAH
jgi:DNA repair exonuclease SbcCD ATPase subunit